MRDNCLWRELPYILRPSPGAQRHIENDTTISAEEMRVLLLVWAVARRFPLVRHQLNEAALRQRVEAVIHRCEGDRRHPSAHSREDVHCGRVIPLFHERSEHRPTLISHAQAASVDAFIRRRKGICAGLCTRLHGRKETPRGPIPYQELLQINLCVSAAPRRRSLLRILRTPSAFADVNFTLSGLSRPAIVEFPQAGAEVAPVALEKRGCFARGKPRTGDFADEML